MTQELNPYQPPLSEIADIEPSRPLELAGKWRRFGTLLIDYIGLTLLTGLIFLAVGLALDEEGVKALERVPDFIIGSVAMLCYYLFFEGLWARTPGKLLLGTVVVDDAGNAPSFGQVSKRSLCRFIPFEPFSFLGERGWHDSISQTHVVRKRASYP